MNGSEIRSPFVERVINLLPQGHEEAMKQAFYNVAAICLFIILGGAAMAVYFILEPFVKPLLWAILIGSVLHPIKHKTVILARGWLSEHSTDNALLIFVFLGFPLKALDMGNEWIGKAILSHLKLILLLTLGVPILDIIQTYFSISDVFYAYENILSYFQPLMIYMSEPFTVAVGTFAIGFVGLIITFASQSRLYVTFNIVWVLTFFYTLVLSGSFSVILILLTLLLFLVGLAIHFAWLNFDDDQSAIVHVEPSTGENVALNVSTPKNQNGLSRLMKSHIVTAALSSLSTPSIFVASPSALKIAQQPSSNRYIYRALWACLAVQLWRNMWLLHLVPIPLVCFLVRLLGNYFNVWTFLHLQISKFVEWLTQLIEEQKHQLFPEPIQWMHKALIYVDRLVIKRLINQLDAVVTVIIIFVVVILAVLASVFVAIQIYGESVHLLQLGTSLVNQTVNNPEARQWLPQGFDKMIDLDSVVDNAYAYGKTGIATLVKNSIKEKDPVRAAQIERVILEALDRVQRAWLTKGDPKAASAKPTLLEDSSSSFFNSSTAKPPFLRRLTQDFFNITVLVKYGRENVGSIFSILDSVWNILKGNLSLVFKSATAILSLLIGGGTTILNFLVNGVVFLTALYYLLVASDSLYKPVELVSFLSPGAGNTLGTAMEQAINTVCMASLKLSVFYGLWTWLIHTVFQVNFVVIPAALAALFGAVPFLGTYWAALPAALDLWLAQKRGVEAVLLMAFQFAPTLFVDAAFYAEIKGGGHPYLTGLAVAGGIFWLGFEGAIIGPLLLCVLLVAVSIYTTLVHNDTQTTPLDSNPRWFHRRLLRTDTVG